MSQNSWDPVTKSSEGILYSLISKSVRFIQLNQKRQLWTKDPSLTTKSDKMVTISMPICHQIHDILPKNLRKHTIFTTYSLITKIDVGKAPNPLSWNRKRLAMQYVTKSKITHLVASPSTPKSKDLHQMKIKYSTTTARNQINKRNHINLAAGFLSLHLACLFSFSSYSAHR